MTRARGNGAADEVWILLVETTRTEGDGLPEGATGAALLCLASAASERRAVDETVQALREAGLAPIEVTSYGTISNPEIELDAEEIALAERALAENAVIVAGMQVLDEDDGDDEGGQDDQRDEADEEDGTEDDDGPPTGGRHRQ